MLARLTLVCCLLFSASSALADAKVVVLGLRSVEGDDDVANDLTEQLRAAAEGLDVERCEEVLRPTDAGDAIDVVLVARRPAG